MSRENVEAVRAAFCSHTAAGSTVEAAPTSPTIATTSTHTGPWTLKEGAVRPRGGSSSISSSIFCQLALDVELVGDERLHFVGEPGIDLGDRLKLDLLVSLTMFIAGPIAQRARRDIEPRLGQLTRCLGEIPVCHRHGVQGALDLLLVVDAAEARLGGHWPPHTGRSLMGLGGPVCLGMSFYEPSVLGLSVGLHPLPATPTESCTSAAGGPLPWPKMRLRESSRYKKPAVPAGFSMGRGGFEPPTNGL
jgi:hypothetical protein